MARTPNIDTEKLKAQGLQLRDAAAVHAGRLAVRAADLAEQGLDWAAPRAQAALSSAIERATPLVESASERAQSVADRAQPFLSDIHGPVVDDYLPRLNKAVSDSATALAAEGDLGSRARAARSASAQALATPTRKKKCCKKKGRLLRALCFTALTAAAAGAGYVLWKRSQPIEDPWAEDYWADLEVEDYSADQNQEASAE